MSSLVLVHNQLVFANTDSEASLIHIPDILRDKAILFYGLAILLKETCEGVKVLCRLATRIKLFLSFFGVAMTLNEACGPVLTNSS